MLQYKMTSIEKLTGFIDNFKQCIFTKAETSYQQLMQQIQAVQIDQPNQQKLQQEDQGSPLEIVNQDKQKTFDGLDQLQLIQSRAAPLKQENKKQSKGQKNKKKRIKEIQQQKKKIASELKELDEQIQQIKGKQPNNKLFNIHNKIQKDQNAQKQAEDLVRQLKNQRKQMEIRKKVELQKTLVQMQKQDEQRRRLRQQQIHRNKEQRRLAIMQRMEQQRKKRQERKLIQVQSNQLIVKLKKQQELQRIASLAPSQIVQVDNKKKVLQKRNLFNLHQIQEHDRKYRQLRIKNQKEKQERAQSLKINKQYESHKYSKNIWFQKIQQQQQRKKEEERKNQQRKKTQLQKRLKYGQLVKNIFLPKKKEAQIDQVVESNKQDKSNNADASSKPRTPQQAPKLPKVNNISKNRTQNLKMTREQSLPGIRKSIKVTTPHNQTVKQFDDDANQKQKIRKNRQHQLRKQTKERLKKLESQSLNNKEVDERVKYKNYLGEVKVKKNQANDWKKIMNNNKLTQQQKYQQIIKKAGDLQTKARKKQDKPNQQPTDQDAVNLYIGSIQAKLALLQKF